MNIVDSQIHVWLPNTPERPWLQGAVNLQGDAFSMGQALEQMNNAGVGRAILVPPSWVGLDNSYALEAAKRYPDRFAVMGRLDPAAIDARQKLARWRGQPGMLGIRMMLNTEAGLAQANEAEYDWFWADCEKNQLPLMVFLAGNGKGVYSLLRRHPDLRLILDHSARNPRGRKDEAAWSDIDDMLLLERYPNVSIKVSSLPCFCSEPYPFQVLHKPIRQIYDAFGARRLLWGSDVTRLTVPYEENIRLFTEALDFLSTDDVEWIMGRAAAHWCEWRF